MDEALRLGSPYGSFQYHAGMVRLALGERDAAREHLEAALQGTSLSPLDRETARVAMDQIGG